MDIDRIRERAEFLALETLVVMLIQGLQDSGRVDRSDLVQTLQKAAQTLRQTHPRKATPEQGDLLMGEMQEAWDRLVQRVLKLPG